MSDWSSGQYLKFEDERTRPVRDLLAPTAGLRVGSAMDLGCGPGNSTEVLVEAHPEARAFGLDSSPDMIEAARRRLPQVPFELGDVAGWAPERPFDLVLANAVLQWLPDHARLFPDLMRTVAPGGVMAVQMPENLDEPSHTAIDEAARDPRWAARLADAGAARTRVATPPDYYALLRPVCAKVEVWRTTYFHPLQGHAGIVEWLKGTGLRPYLQRLEAGDQAGFLDLYCSLLERAYPLQADGTVLLAFPRLFILATR